MRFPLSAKLLVLLVAGVTLLLHASALGGWWLNDDPQVLLHAKRNSPAAVISDPAAWGTLSTANYTPLVTISFDLDLMLFGTNVRGFYAHQLVALTICFSLFAILLFRLTSSWWGSLTASLAIVASPAAVLAARQLMLRHYVEGAVLAIAAMLLWFGAFRKADPNLEDRTPMRGFSWIAAFLYFVSMLAKEIYTPLPLLFLAVEMRSKTTMRQLTARLAPSALAAIIYLLLRRRQLGSGGGYGSIESEKILDLPFDVMKTMFAGSGLAIVALVLVALCALLFVRKGGKRSLPVLGLALIFTLLPLIAVAGSFELRYGWIPALCLGSLLAAVWARSLFAKALVVSLGVLVAFAGFEQRKRSVVSEQEMITEGRYVWNGSETGAVLLADSPGWYLSGLRDLRLLDRGENSPRFVLSEEAFLLGEVEPGKVIDVVGAKLEPVAEGRRAVIMKMQPLRGASLLIDVRMERRTATLSWMVGPPCDCDYRLVTLPELETFPIPRQGSRRVPIPTEQQFVRVLRVERDGRWNVTPPIPLPAEGATTSMSVGTAMSVGAHGSVPAARAGRIENPN